jgi:hypothetical protein
MPLMAVWREVRHINYRMHTIGKPAPAPRVCLSCGAEPATAWTILLPQSGNGRRPLRRLLLAGPAAEHQLGHVAPSY